MNLFFYGIFSFICKNCKQIYLMSQQVLRSNNELFMHFDLIKIFDLIICRLMCQQRGISSAHARIKFVRRVQRHFDILSALPRVFNWAIDTFLSFFLESDERL